MLVIAAGETQRTMIDSGRSACGASYAIEQIAEGTAVLQLIYASTVTPDRSDNDIATLCEQAVRNNLRDEVTGVLVARDGHFLQVIEGPKEVIEDTFLRIVNDPRHHSLLLLSRLMVTARQFGEWAMTACEDDGEQRAMIARVDRMIGHAPPHIRQQFATLFPT